MNRFFRKCGNDKNRLEWQLTLVVLLALLTMSMMSSYMDMGRGAEMQVASAALSGSGGTESSAQEGILRLHVVANSDSEADQNLKLQVRNKVLTKVQEGLADCFARETGSTEELTRTWIRAHMEEIRAWAEEEVKAQGYDYTVEVSLGVTWIPEKEYGEICFPAGNYEALRIVIGEGNGQNWWCVIFPPLCLIEGCNEKEAARLEQLCGNKVILKCRILELLGK